MPRVIAALLTLLLIAPLAIAADDADLDETDKIRAYLERRRVYELERREERIEEMVAEERQLSKDRGTKAGRDRLIRLRKEMAPIRAEIVFLKKVKNPRIDTIDPIKTDTIGYLKTSVKVLQVIDDDTVLGDVGETGVLLKGFDASTLAEGKSVRLPGVVEVRQTKKYTTVLGSTRTVYMIEPFDVDRANKELDVILKAREAKKAPVEDDVKAEDDQR